MSMIPIDADILFRAVTATGFKLLAYHLNLDTGEISSRTLRPDEVSEPPPGPSVQPLPKLGGDLTPKKDALPFGPPPTTEPKKKLFADDDEPKKSAFDNDFFKRDDKKKIDPFGDGGFKRESGSKKLAELFSDAPKPKKIDPFAKPADVKAAAPAAPAPKPAAPAAPENPRNPRIPAVRDEQLTVWLHAFAKDCGDPEIRDGLLHALKSAKPVAAFERELRKHQRMGQQFERWFRNQALLYAETWLSDLGISWELIEPSEK